MVFYDIIYIMGIKNTHNIKLIGKKKPFLVLPEDSLKNVKKISKEGNITYEDWEKITRIKKNHSFKPEINAIDFYSAMVNFFKKNDKLIKKGKSTTHYTDLYSYKIFFIDDAGTKYEFSIYSYGIPKELKTYMHMYLKKLKRNSQTYQTIATGYLNPYTENTEGIRKITYRKPTTTEGKNLIELLMQYMIKENK